MQENLRRIKFLRTMEKMDSRKTSSFIHGRFDKYVYHKHRAIARGLQYVNITNKSTNNFVKKIARTPIFKTSTENQMITNIIYHGMNKHNDDHSVIFKLVILAMEFKKYPQEISTLIQLSQQVIFNHSDNIQTQKINDLEKFILHRKYSKFYNDKIKEIFKNNRTKKEVYNDIIHQKEIRNKKFTKLLSENQIIIDLPLISTIYNTMSSYQQSQTMSKLNEAITSSKDDIYIITMIEDEYYLIAPKFMNNNLNFIWFNHHTQKTRIKKIFYKYLPSVGYNLYEYILFNIGYNEMNKPIICEMNKIKTLLSAMEYGGDEYIKMLTSETKKYGQNNSNTNTSADTLNLETLNEILSNDTHRIKLCLMDNVNIAQKKNLNDIVAEYIFIALKSFNHSNTNNISLTSDNKKYLSLIFNFIFNIQREIIIDNNMASYPIYLNLLKQIHTKINNDIK